MNPSNRPRLLLADDHRVVAEGLKSLLAPEFQLLEVVEDGRALVEAAIRLCPDVVLADISMPQLNGIDALVQIRRVIPGIRMVFLTMHPEVAYARRAMEEGALGYVLKHSAPAELVTAIRAALRGQTYITPLLAGAVLQSLRQGKDPNQQLAESLTPRQREILQLLVEGRSAKEIAGALGISTRTVEFHKYRMMENLGITTNAELVRFAIQNQIVPL